MPPATSPLIERVRYRDGDHSYHLANPCEPCASSGREAGAREGTTRKCGRCKGEGHTLSRIPSVTTLLGNLSKPALVWWSARLGAEAVVAWWEENAIPKPGEFGRYVGVDEADIATLYELARYAHNHRKVEAATKGSDVHEAIDGFQVDYWSAEPPTEPVARASWDVFVEWWATAGFTCLSTERVVVDARGRYAGRLDMLLEETPRPGCAPRLFVADVKTSGGLYAEHVYQNAAYAAALETEINRPIAGTKVLWLPEGATEMTVVDRNRSEWFEDFRMFESLIGIHHHRKALDKLVQQIKQTHGPKDPA